MDCEKELKNKVLSAVSKDFWLKNQLALGNQITSFVLKIIADNRDLVISYIETLEKPVEVKEEKKPLIKIKKPKKKIGPKSIKIDFKKKKKFEDGKATAFSRSL